MGATRLRDSQGKPADSHRLSPRALGAIVATLVLLLVEGGSYLIIALSPRLFHEPIRRVSSIYAEKRDWMHRIAENPAGRTEIDSVLGWRFRPGFRGEGDTINAQGLRSGREYSRTPAPSVLRVAAFGESFVYASEVTNDSAWTTRVERLDPRIEMLNYAVGGYGDDQAYLRFRADGRTLTPHIAMLGFATDDLRRVTNVFFPYISSLEVPLVKPRFVLGESGTLDLIPSPAPNVEAFLQLADDPAALRALGKHDQWYERAIYSNPLYDHSATVRLASYLWAHVARRYLDPDRIWNGRELSPQSPGFRIQSEVFSRFVSDADSMGIAPVILLLPDRESVERARHGERTLYWTLAAEVTRRNLPCVDAIHAFVAQGDTARVGDWFAPGGHYSGAGNEVVAAWLTSVLSDAASRPQFHIPGGIGMEHRCRWPST